MKTLKKALLLTLPLALLPVTSQAAENAQSLDQLLNHVKQGRISDAGINKQRERQFLQQKNSQQKQLGDARKTQKRLETESSRLEKLFESNERLLSDKQQQLKERMGNLTELFGHLTSSSNDLRSVVSTSLVSSQYPDRTVFLDQFIEELSNSETLPGIEQIERLWYELQREMTESGKVVAFNGTVVKPNGDTASEQIVRIGSFNIVSEQGKYLSYQNGSLLELPRQPAGSYQDWAQGLAASSSGMTAFGVDPTGPSGGTLLAALIDSPTLVERWHQGGMVGYVITGIGGLALLIALWRILTLSLVGIKVKSQLKKPEPNLNNPLGRLLAVHARNPQADTETLELKLSEAVLREVPKLEYGSNLLKIISAVAPLLGLLGTVTGMIITFQAITIFGAGDPKAMAGGISSALVTTVLGLVVAIPTVLLHTLVSSRVKKITAILFEQTAGLIAQQNEQNLGQRKVIAEEQSQRAGQPEAVTA